MQADPIVNHSWENLLTYPGVSSRPTLTGSVTAVSQYVLLLSQVVWVFLMKNRNRFSPSMISSVVGSTSVWCSEKKFALYRFIQNLRIFALTTMHCKHAINAIWRQLRIHKVSQLINFIAILKSICFEKPNSTYNQC